MVAIIAAAQCWRGGRFHSFRVKFQSTIADEGFRDAEASNKCHISVKFPFFRGYFLLFYHRLWSYGWPLKSVDTGLRLYRLFQSEYVMV